MEVDIYRDIRQMQKDFERMLHAWNGFDFWPEAREREFKGVRIPLADVKEEKDKIIATIEVPGVSKEDIDLNLTDSTLEIKAQSKSEKEEKGKQSYEYRSSEHKFYRALPLPAKVRFDQAIATYKNGILKVEMPKLATEEKKMKRIEVK